MEHFDVIVIGAGPGGYVAAIRAARLGFSTAVVESEALGGVCLNWGCIPTKSLLKSAQALHYAQNGSSYGFAAADVKADLTAMVARSREVSATMSKGIEYLFKKNGITVINGRGRLAPGHNVVVEAEGGERFFSAGHIILATGSRPNSLPFAPIDGRKIISYRQALCPDTLPASLAVMGSGAIGSELAFFYRSLGVEVTLIEYLDRILPLEDDDVCAQISRSFRKMGMKVMTGARVKSVDTASDSCVLEVETSKGTSTVAAEKVLSAVGVVPNVQNLGLEECGVVLERGRVKVDASYQTTCPGVYAIGDIIATPALAHVASAEAVCCVEGIAGLNPSPVNYACIPGCTYTGPETASCGITERYARESGITYKVGKFPYTASGKAAASGERDGFVKIISDASSDKVLGVHMVGANVSEMIGGMVAAVNLGVTSRQLASTVFPHPTMSEALMEAAAAVSNEAIHI